MKLGFVSAILPELSLDQVLAFAAAERFGCVEIMCWPVGKAERKFAGVTHIDVNELSKSQVEDIHSLCAKHNVSISGLGFYPNPLDPDLEVSSKAVDHLRKVIVGAEKLGLQNVNTFVGRDWTKSVDDNWPRFLEIWKPLIAFAEDHGVKIGIENCPMFFTKDEWPGGKNLATTPVIWRRMFNDIPSNSFGLNYDPSHFVLQHMDPASPLREFQDKLFHCHAKDVKLSRARLNEVGVFAHPLEWHQPRIPGYGDMDWGHYMGCLMETTYRGPMCIEVEDDTFGKSLEGRKQAVKVARNVLEPFFA
ncbi:MAG: sugar phosphate isomerase/epimerase family protein [Verrucomicrobiia bacterium]